MNNHTLLISYKTSSAAELNAAVMSYDHSFDIFHQRQSQVFLIHLDGYLLDSGGSIDRMFMQD